MKHDLLVPVFTGRLAILCQSMGTEYYMQAGYDIMDDYCKTMCQPYVDFNQEKILDKA